MVTPDTTNILYNALEEQLKILGLSFSKPSGISKAILEASAYFIQKQGVSPWSNKSFQGAYIAHFLPMNILRWMKVFERINSKDFSQRNHFVDFGAGPLTFKLAHFLKYPQAEVDYKFIELEDAPTKIGLNIFASLQKQLGSSKHQKQIENFKNFQAYTKAFKNLKSQTLVLSYSLNELKNLPPDFWNFENILILEPSTQESSRALLEFRKLAITNDFNVLAPCLHSSECPMLLHSKKDWCFDRTHINLPDLAQNLYKSLPFETKHLTFSYLWTSKQQTLAETNSFRVVGDTQKEKGKEKVMICRSSDREFLSWLKKDGVFKGHSRGDEDFLDFSFEMKGNEIRIKP